VNLYSLFLFNSFIHSINAVINSFIHSAVCLTTDP